MSLHGRRKSGSTVSALLGALAAGVLVMVALAAGCGASAAAEKTATQTDSDTYGRLLADRYDDVFPDDRVLTVRIVMDDADWQSMQVSAMAKDYYKADIWIDNELVQDVAVRTKGSSSLSQALSSGSFRAGLKVELNFFNSARNYHGIKKLCYSNGFSDPTLMKEFLGYEVMAAMGIPTPRACFVDVWVNDAHLGVYTQVEAIDARFVQDNFADGNGNLYKPETLAGRLDWTESDVVAQAAAREDRAAAEGSPAAGAQASPTTTTTAESFNVGGGDLEEIIERLGEGAAGSPAGSELGKAEARRPPRASVATAEWASACPPAGAVWVSSAATPTSLLRWGSRPMRTRRTTPAYTSFWRCSTRNRARSRPTTSKPCSTWTRSCATWPCRRLWCIWTTTPGWGTTTTFTKMEASFR